MSLELFNEMKRIMKSKKNVMKFPLIPTSLQEAFDFSVLYVTANEVAQIRFALESKSIVLEKHAVLAAKDDAITPDQILNVIAVGIPTTKDLETSKTRQPGVNFEGRAGGARKIRVKVSWDGRYYVVTVHSIVKIKR